MASIGISLGSLLKNRLCAPNHWNCLFTSMIQAPWQKQTFAKAL
jgi:hypothetical protein